MKYDLIMDCDPGIDDMVALLMAMADPETFNILGVTAVAGNVSLAPIQRNARQICELANRKDIPVYAGCPRALMKPREDGEDVAPGTYSASEIHGASGLGNLTLPDPVHPLQAQHAVDFIIQTLRASSKKVTLTPTGALTNIAAAFIQAPDIVKKIDKIVLMGGVIGLGNITPAAEYNFYSDPHAAHVVFTSGADIVMIGLDTTRKLVATADVVEKLSQQPNKVSQTVAQLLGWHFRPGAIHEPGVEGGLLHDPAVVAYLLKPDLFGGRHVHVEIDITGQNTMGRSTVDWYHKTGRTPNAFVVDTVNAQGFYDLMIELLGRYQH